MRQNGENAMAKLSITPRRQPLSHHRPAPRPQGSYSIPLFTETYPSETAIYLEKVTQKKITLMRSGCALGTCLWAASLSMALAGGPTLLEVLLMGGAFTATGGGWLTARLI